MDGIGNKREVIKDEYKRRRMRMIWGKEMKEEMRKREIRRHPKRS